jgi:hypothetical protein
MTNKKQEFFKKQIERNINDRYKSKEGSPYWKAFFILFGLITFTVGIFQSNGVRTVGGLGLLILGVLLDGGE